MRLNLTAKRFAHKGIALFGPRALHHLSKLSDNKLYLTKWAKFMRGCFSIKILIKEKQKTVYSIQENLSKNILVWSIRLYSAPDPVLPGLGAWICLYINPHQNLSVLIISRCIKMLNFTGISNSDEDWCRGKTRMFSCKNIRIYLVVKYRNFLTRLMSIN